jgi:PAS domain S-box-containing protein
MPTTTSVPYFLQGGGDAGARLRAHNWRGFGAGPPHRWPASLRTLVSMMLASNQAMFIAWGPRRELLYNDAYAEILAAKHPALGRDFLDVWCEIRPALEPIVAATYRGEPVRMDDIELTMMRRGFPEETHFSFFYAPVHDDHGVVSGLFCACAEITAQVMAERKLRQRDERHRDLLVNMGEGFLMLDHDFRVLEANDAIQALHGKAPQAMTGHVLWTLFPGLHDHPFGQLYRRALATRQPQWMEHDVPLADGRRRWFEVRADPIQSGLAIFVRDVTERRRTERAALESSERVQLALDAGAIVGTWVWNVRDDVFVADERFALSFGLPAEACQRGITLSRVMQPIHPDDLGRVREALQAALSGGGAYRCEYRVRHGDGTDQWVEAIGRVEFDADGRPLRFPGLLTDIGARRRAEAERDAAHALLRNFIDAVPGVVYAKDHDGRLLVVNRGFAELFGTDHDACIGRLETELEHQPREAAEARAHDLRVMQGGGVEQLEETLRRPDGSTGWWLSTKAPLRDAAGRVVGLIGSSVDIGALKHEQERARSETEIVELLNRTGATLAAELELDTLLQHVTDAATRLTGAQFGAFFYNGVDDRGEAYMLYTLSGAPKAAFDGFGHPRPTPLFAPTFHGGPALRIADVRRDPRYGQWAPHHGMPRGHLPVRSYLAVPVTSRGGAVIGGMFFGHEAVGVFTERAERLAVGIAAQAAVAIDNARLYAAAQQSAAERTRLLDSERAARAEAERASTLKDEFLAALSHELRTPLSAIVGWLHVLRLKAGADETLAKGLAVIERSTRAQTQLIEDLLDMSRITSGKLRLELRPAAPRAVVEAAIEAVRPAAAAAGVAIRLDAADDPPVVLGDAERLQQVLWNLLSNAVKFSSRGAGVLVTLDLDADAVRIAVRDHGVGIRADFLPHVFDRFRQADGSTTRRFGGLGLGLSIAHRLVEMHGGRIAAESAGVGQGACFTVWLPRADAVEGALLPAAATSVDLAGVRVMVVDDDADVLDLLRRVLTDAGADVHAAASATLALQAWPDARPQVIVSDIGMPEMDGFELLRRLRRLPRDEGGATPAIALTAFARPEDVRQALEAGFDVHLAKPVQPAELLARIAELAGRARQPDDAEAT